MYTMSIRSYMRVRPFSSIPKQNWAKLAMEQTLQRLKDREELLEVERKYHREVRERLEEKIGFLQRDILRLRNNFNLRGALEFSLDEYKKLHKIPEAGRMPLLQHLIKHQAYQACLVTVTERYQLRKEDINSCVRMLYHELSKHAHGNTAELAVVESEHTITEIAALEAVFCALKNEGCFRIPLKLYFKNNQERQL
ncbi:hypothetical protein EDB92DRAFT_209132 [Lactarius akahatsu]|uniref:Uncharacterized protein n=1 Tax=Lactarius akahatsu TaxID=416441 RepID=A0AAD4LK55_9AGAM|nr:hypothetical protein EDB92DRAFT_209132 [Lactarius akahatsu]